MEAIYIAVICEVLFQDDQSAAQQRGSVTGTLGDKMNLVHSLRLCWLTKLLAGEFATAHKRAESF